LTKLVPGFEAGGPNTPSNIDPWLIIGDESSITVGTDRTSCFERNPVALRMEVLCDSKRTNACPSGGVGVYNPGYWGMVWYFHLIIFLKKNMHTGTFVDLT
jgi:alpha-N-arabinofuranosidase